MKLWKLYKHHHRTLVLPFQSVFTDPVLLENARNRKYRKHYLFPLLISTIIIIDTGIQYYQYGVDLDHRLFHHVTMAFMPQLLLRQSNGLFAALYTLTFLTNFFLFFDTIPHGDFILLKSGNKMIFPYRKPELRSVKPKLGQKLWNFHDRFRKQTERIVLLMSVEVHNAFIVPTIFITLYKMYESNWEYIPDSRFIFFNALCFSFFESFVFSNHVGIRFIGQNGMIQLKQKHYCFKMNRNRISNTRRTYLLWRETMANILDITREIIQYNRFYSKYMTNLMGTLIFLTCNNINIVTSSAGKVSVILLSIWGFYDVMYVGCLLLFNAASSQTINLNVRLFKKLRQMQIRLLSRRNLNYTQVVKLDLVNEYKLLLQKCSFRLLNSSTINNKLFVFEVFGCLGVVWMKLVSNESWIS